MQSLIIGLVLLAVAFARAGAELDRGPATSIAVVGALVTLGASAALYLPIQRQQRRMMITSATT